MSRTAFDYIDTPEGMTAALSSLADAGDIALDTESNTLHSYYERVCLLQITANDLDYIFDPYAPIDLMPLLDLMRHRRLIIHGADYDLRLLYKNGEFRPKGAVFDTMLAAQLAGHTEISLAALVERYCGITLCKANKRSDWTRRPLSQEQLQYAANDTRFLHCIAEKLEEELRALGRLEWHDQSVAKVIEATALIREADPETEWRVKGSGRLDGHALAALRALWQWREDEAERSDLPPFKIMGNIQLTELALWVADNANGTPKTAPNVPNYRSEGRLNRLFRTLDQSKRIPKNEWPPRRPPRTRTEPEPDVRPLVERLQATCAELGEELNLQPSIVAPRASLVALARNRPDSPDEIVACSPLLPWQANLLAPRVIPILASAK